MMLFALGRCFFGAAVAASGVLQLMTGEFVRLVPNGAAGVVSSSAGPYLTGVVLIVAGSAIVFGRIPRLAGGFVAALILLSFFLRQMPQVISNPWAGFMWTSPLKALALGGGALLAGTLPSNEGQASLRVRGPDRYALLGAALLTVFLAVCGVQHFVYRDFVAGLVPSWIPQQRFWTYFTGMALIAGGLGIQVRVTAWLAAVLSAVMVFSWVLLLHIPRALAGPNHANETAGVFEALAVSGIALMVAATVGVESRNVRRASPLVGARSAPEYN